MCSQIMIRKGDRNTPNLVTNPLLGDDSEECQKIKSKQYSRNSKILIVIGGYHHRAVSHLEYYDFDQEKWSEVKRTPFTIWRTSLVTVEDKVYVLGGSRDGSYSSAVSIYDITTNNWQDTVSMATERAGHSATVLNCCIYAIGGYNGKDTMPLNSCEKFDLVTQQWKAIAPMFTKRGEPGVAVLNGIIYVVGGRDGNSNLRSVECYNEHIDSWKNVCNMKESRAGLRTCALDGKMYAIGGMNDAMEHIATVEVYDPNTDCWTEITPMSIPRTWAGVAIVDNRIYVVGGTKFAFQGSASVEVYDKLTNKWTIMNERMNGGCRVFHGVTVLHRSS